ncbi:hypothetical protein NIES2104_23130 [Leptolyngbya sp. NIES-2104]|nr:hypothetical protein NIES2104_23130 [Leptolyngbya sp. NIES-2104]
MPGLVCAKEIPVIGISIKTAGFSPVAGISLCESRAIEFFVKILDLVSVPLPGLVCAKVVVPLGNDPSVLGFSPVAGISLCERALCGRFSGFVC